jgi:hypothetical protein
MLKNFKLPHQLPNRKILSVDIGGTLAKAAFYVPRDDPIHTKPGALHNLTSMCIPCKFTKGHHFYR